MSKHSTWAIIFAGLLFVVFPKIMLGTEYGIVVDGKLTKLGAIVGRSTSPRRSRSTEVPTANTRCTKTTASALITSKAIQSRH